MNDTDMEGTTNLCLQLQLPLQLPPVDHLSFRNSPTILRCSAGNALLQASGSKAPQRRGLARAAPTAGPNAPLIQGMTCLVSHSSETVASLFNKDLDGPPQQSLLVQLMLGQMSWQSTQSSCCLFFPHQALQSRSSPGMPSSLAGVNASFLIE